MATHTGQLAVDQELTLYGYTQEGWLIDDLGLSTITNQVHAVSVQSINLDGALVENYGGIWFDRLHALPGIIDLGTLRVVIEEITRIYNAGRLADDVTAIDETDTDGLLILEALPETIPARKSVPFTLQATLDGPEKIAARFLFEGDTSALFLVFGRRLLAEIWPIKPDWSEPVLEWFGWRTDLQPHKDGSETRRVVYQYPRRGLEFRVVVKDQKLDRLLTGFQSMLFNVPRWQDVTYTTAAVNAGDMAIDFDTAVGEWRVGGQVVLLNGDKYEAPLVSAIRVDGLDFANELENDWPAGTPVYPARIMRVPSVVEVSRPTAGLVIARLSFEASRDTSTSYTGQDSATLFDTVPVYLDPPNRRSPASLGYTRESTTLDNPAGFSIVDDVQGDMLPTHQWQYLLKDRAKIDGFIKWLFARQGRFLRFRYPTWSTDLVPVEQINPGVSELAVQPIDWIKFYQGQPQRSAIAIQTHDGVWRFANIIDSEIISGVERLTLDRNLVAGGGSIIPIAQIKRVCWLELVRLDADRIELSWLTAGVAESTLPMRGIE